MNVVLLQKVVVATQPAHEPPFVLTDRSQSQNGYLARNPIRPTHPRHVAFTKLYFTPTKSHCWNRLQEISAWEPFSPSYLWIPQLWEIHSPPCFPCLCKQLNKFTLLQKLYPPPKL